MFEQKFRQVGIGVPDRLIQRRAPVVADGVDVGSPLDQQPHDITVIAGPGAQQRSKAAGVDDIHPGALIEQQAHYLRVTVKSGAVKRRAARTGADIDIGPAGQERFHYIGMIVVGGLVKQAVSPVIDRGEQLRVRRHRPRDGGQVSLLGGREDIDFGG